MCVVIRNKDTGKEACSLIAFADMLDVDVHELPSSMHGRAGIAPYACLCQIDVEKACAMFGYSYLEHANSDIEISKKSHEEILKDTIKHR